MHWLYITVMWVAALLVADDMGLGQIHPVRGFIIIGALIYNVAYTVYKWERKCKCAKRD